MNFKAFFAQIILPLLFIFVHQDGQKVQACLQVDLLSMSNSNGQITDYLTEDDEIGVWIGVGELFMYLYQNLFLPNQVDPFPSQAVSFPCFKNEAMYISMVETDGYVSDRAQVSLECNNLQLG